MLFEKIGNGEKVSSELLQQALKSGQLTLRAYAARVLGEQGDETSIPFLIDTLTDQSFHVGASYLEPGMATTRYWANESLKKLSGEDFGFVWDAPQAERDQAIDRWRRWYRDR